jgi:hypothetical protein
MVCIFNDEHYQTFANFSIKGRNVVCEKTNLHMSVRKSSSKTWKKVNIIFSCRYILLYIQHRNPYTNFRAFLAFCDESFQDPTPNLVRAPTMS